MSHNYLQKSQISYQIWGYFHLQRVRRTYFQHLQVKRLYNNMVIFLYITFTLKLVISMKWQQSPGANRHFLPSMSWSSRFSCISNTEGYVSYNSSSPYLCFYRKFKKKEKHFCTCILIYRGEIKDGWWKPHVLRKIWESVYLLWKRKEFLRA